MDHKKQTGKEIAWSIIILVLIAGGSVFDATKTELLVVDNLAAVSMTSLQLQTSISSVSIALITILSAVISEEFYGVSVSYYYTSIRPIWYTQKRIIIVEIILVGVNMLMHLLKLYNIVIAILWVSCILIILSVEGIYSAFRGKECIKGEILSYVEYIFFDSAAGFQEKRGVFEGFVKYWSAQNQNKVDYKNEKKIFEKAVAALLIENDIEALAVISSSVADLIKRMLANSDFSQKYRAIDIFIATYKQVWKYIVDNNNKHIECPFELYDDCVDDLVVGIHNIPIDDLETLDSWESVTDFICRINIYCHDKKSTDNSSLKRNINIVCQLPLIIGKLLAYKRKNGNEIHARRWGFDRNILSFCDDNIPADVLDEYKKTKCELEFAYYYSLLRTNQADLAGTFFDRVNYNTDKVDFYEVLSANLVFCYTYYIADRESLSCVTRDEKGAARFLLSKYKDESRFQSFIEAICWKISATDFLKLYKDTVRILSSYEIMPFAGEMKLCIIENVIKDYELFVSILLHGYIERNDIVECFFSDMRAESIYLTYLGNNLENTRNTLNHILELFVNLVGLYNPILESGLESFSSMVIDNYKKEGIEEANKDYIEFELRNNEELLKKLEKKLIDKLRNKFGQWLPVPDQQFTEERVVLMKYSMPIKFLDEKLERSVYSYLEGNLFAIIVDRLNRVNKLNLYERNMAENTETYFQFLKNCKCQLMVGPDFSFEPHDYKQRECFDQLIPDFNRVHIGRGKKGLLLKRNSVRMSIVKLTISYHQMRLSECKYKKEKKSDNYCYEITEGNVIPFTKRELEEYISKGYVVLDISAKLNMQIISEKCGYLVERKLTKK